MITVEQFQQLFPKADDPEGWVEAFEQVLSQYEIDTPERIAAFISQCGVETGGWRWFEENMNYSADRMRVIWPSRFNADLAQQCHRNPEMVANHAYANRMGNGGPESGDGWRYRGRGPIHLTGRNNYTAFAEDMFSYDPDEIILDPDRVAHDKEVALKSAVWFWKANKLNQVADTRDITRLTKKVNGGTNGLSERIALFEEVYHMIA